MLQLFRLADRFDLQPVKRSRQGAQSRGFFHPLNTANLRREESEQQLGKRYFM